MSKKRRSLLLLDDDATLRRSLKRLLRDRFDVDDVATVDEAKAALLEGEFDIAVLDVFDSDRRATGLELLPWLVARSPRTAPIMLSGSGEISHAVRAMQRGAVAFVEKRADPGELLSVLDTWHEDLPPLDTIEWVYVHRMLGAHRGNVSATARRVGRSRQGLSKMVRRTPPRARSTARE